MANPLLPQRGGNTLIHAIVDDQALVAAVRELEPADLGRLIRHIGLADSGELFALATPEQVRGLADDDLWHAEAPGEVEAFDPERFATWLEVLVDAGPQVAVDTLLALDEDLVAHALSQQLFVLDLEQLAVTLSTQGPGALSDDDIAVKLLEAHLSLEIDELILLALRHDGWDALVTVICELDQSHHDVLRRILDRLCAASMDRVAEDGLYTVLSEAERLAEDSRGERDDRRERRGFVSSADARAFLEAARQRPREADASPIVRGYFRHYEPAPPAQPSAALSRLVSYMREHGALPARALPELSGSSSPARAALAALREADDATHGQRLAELVFLGNVVMSGSGVAGDPPNQVDALTEVLRSADRAFADGAVDNLADHSLIEAFALGWSARR